MCCSTPSPPHFGQAPNGLLNENSRGSISGMVKPDTGQANFSENTRRSGPRRGGRDFGFFLTLGRRAVRQFRHRQPVGELERLLQRIRQPRGNVRPHHQAVDHDVDVVIELLVERRHRGDLVERAVDFDALVALPHKVGELLAVLALASAHHRREQIKPRAFRQRQDAIDHLRHGLALDRQPGRRRIGHAGARPQKPHVVVDLGDGADRRARIARGGFLLDGDGGRQAVDLVDVRLLHHLQELPRVSRQALDVAALALGIDGVEGKRGFAGAGQPGEHHELVAGNVEIDIFEVVLAGAADRNHAAVLRALGIGAAVLAGGAAGALVGAVEEIVHSAFGGSFGGSLMRNGTRSRGLARQTRA